jgi:hypothetical protein
MGLLINLAGPFGVAMIAILLIQTGTVEPAMNFIESPLLFYVLGGVAIMELAAGHFVRRTLFSVSKAREVAHDPAKTEQWVLRSSIVLFALGASPMFYGVVVYLLGGEISQLAFFGILTLVGYRLLRPTSSLLEETLAAAQRP